MVDCVRAQGRRVIVLVMGQARRLRIILVGICIPILHFSNHQAREHKSHTQMPRQAD